MDIFDQFGIKEVADCTLYSIHKKKDGSGDIYFVPALFLDTLKVSSIGKTSQNVWAQGGVGNNKYICWDYGKDITLQIQDALCSPASLNLCWGGILSANWDNNGINLNTGEINGNEIVVQRFSRINKYFYPFDIDNRTVGYMLPCSEKDIRDNPFGLVNKSSIIDGIKIEGYGYIKCQIYKWMMEIDSSSCSIWKIPDRFYDVYGRPYKIIRRVNFNYPWIDNRDYGTRVMYKINRETPQQGGTYNTIEEADFLEVRIDNNGNFSAWLGDADSLNRAKEMVPDPKSFIKNDKIELCQFKDGDIWRKFDGINEMIYFLITKYNKNIINIESTDLPKFIKDDPAEGDMRLWSYINPKTMKPYPDDYWFYGGESFLLKTFTLVPRDKSLLAKRIEVKSDQFPGMYMLVGETYIRDKETKKDKRMQFRIPLCKIKTDNTISLTAEGESTVFDMIVEVAVPKDKIMMELTTYETAPRLELDNHGELVLKDGSEDILGIRGD